MKKRKKKNESSQRTDDDGDPPKFGRLRFFTQVLRIATDAKEKNIKKKERRGKNRRQLLRLHLSQTENREETHTVQHTLAV
jgi:hypothetical protein